MLIRRPPDVPSSEITDERLYLKRREFLETFGLAAAGLAVGVVSLDAQPAGRPPKLDHVVKGPFGTTEAMTPYEDVTTYNNFYEFGSDKSSPSQRAGSLRTRPWTVKVDGECNHPANYEFDDLVKPYALEERVYRMRCVEGVVDGHSVGRHSARRHHQAIRADLHARSSSSSPRCSTRARCRASAARCSTGRTWKGCGSTRRCTR